jgi:transcriptional repressor of cell division inhibition gene dicB
VVKISVMNKKTALKLFDGEPKRLAAAIGITVQAVSKWPDELPSKISDRVEAAYHRLNGAALPTATASEGVAQ